MAYCTSANKELSMTIRKNLKEYEPKWAEECKKFEAACGFPVTFEFQATPADLKKVYQGYDERVGEFVLAHLTGAIEVMIPELKDDMIKEAFTEAVTAKKLVLVPVEGVGSYNARWVIKDGVFRIEYEPANFGYNCDAQMVRSWNKLEKLF